MSHINLKMKILAVQETPESIAKIKFSITKDNKHEKYYTKYFEKIDDNLEELYLFPFKCYTDYLEHFEEETKKELEKK